MENERQIIFKMSQHSGKMPFLPFLQMDFKTEDKDWASMSISALHL